MFGVFILPKTQLNPQDWPLTLVHNPALFFHPCHTQQLFLNDLEAYQAFNHDCTSELKHVLAGDMGAYDTSDCATSPVSYRRCPVA